MEKRRGTAFIMVISLIISVIGLGVAFAAFSTTLTINGTATVQASSWNVIYSASNTDGGTDPGSTGVSITPTTSNTQTGIASTATGTGTLKTADFTWDATFKTPGDRVSYTFYVCNKGTYNAKLTSINKPAVTCKKGGVTETTVCSKISYEVSTDAAGSTALAQDSTIAAGTCQQVYVVSTLSDTLDAADLPDASVITDKITVSLTYTQY